LVSGSPLGAGVAGGGLELVKTPSFDDSPAMMGTGMLEAGFSEVLPSSGGVSERTAEAKKRVNSKTTNFSFDFSIV
jgi:hypothetical protein